jgi:hypothetical protein
MMPLRPRSVCEALLSALDASEGRRRRRKRDTTPDAIGLAIKRELLGRAAQEDPEPDRFEAWLLAYCLSAADQAPPGPLQAMARDVLEDWRLAAAEPEFQVWLASGAPSEDRDDGLAARPTGG